MIIEGVDRISDGFQLEEFLERFGWLSRKNKTEQIIAELNQNHWINQVIQEIELILHNSTELFQINIKFAGLYRCIEEIRSFGKIRILWILLGSNIRHLDPV